MGIQVRHVAVCDSCGLESSERAAHPSDLILPGWEIDDTGTMQCFNCTDWWARDVECLIAQAEEQERELGFTHEDRKRALMPAMEAMKKVRRAATEGEGDIPTLEGFTRRLAVIFGLEADKGSELVAKWRGAANATTD